MEIGEGEAAPRSAEDGEPRDAVHGLKQGPGEGEQIQKFLAVGKVFDFDGAEGNTALAEQRQKFGEMRARANENSDAVFGVRGVGARDEGQMPLEDAQDFIGFVAARFASFILRGSTTGGADDLRMEVEGRRSGRRR